MKHVQSTLVAIATGTVLLAGALAASAEDASLPAAHHRGSVAYISGGIGKDQALAFMRAAADYPLTLEFVADAGHRREFLSDVPVTIQDHSGRDVLRTTTEGPFLLVNLPRGEYKVTARYGGRTEQRIVNVGRMDHHRLAFEWGQA
jgi:hypothetical protein